MLGFCAAAAALAATGGGLAMAQSADTVISGETVLDEIIVTLPSRAARPLQETPAAVTVVDEGEAVRRQASTFEELIGDVPGVSIDGGPRGIGQEPNIRGFQDEQIVTRVDGARQNFNIAHRGRFFIDPDIVERVEVLRGGSSALYGSGAIGGVIGLRTKSADDLLEPGETYGARLKAGYASNNDEVLGTATAYGVFGAFDALGFVAFRDPSGNLVDGDGDDILDSEIDNRNVIGKLGFQATDDLRFELNAQYYEDEGQTPNAADGKTSFNTLVDRDIAVQSYRLSTQYAPAGSDLIDLDAILYYNFNDLEEDRVNVNSFDMTEYTTIGFEATNRSRFMLGAPIELAYGVEFYRDEQTGERELPDFEFPDASLTFYAAFAQADVALTEALTLTPGVRFDFFSLDPDGDFDSRSESQLSPKLALSYAIDDSHTIWASASQSFRAPSLTELYQDGVHFAVPFGPPFGTGVNAFVPTPDLEPERADQVEAGLRVRHRDVLSRGDRISFEANAYYASVTDFIDTVVVGPTPVVIPGGPPFFAPTFAVEDGATTNFNVDAELWGFEGELRYDGGPWFFGLGGAIPRGRAQDGGALGSIPQDRATVTLGLRPLHGLEIGGRSTFRDGQDDVPEQVDPSKGSTVIDLFAVYAPTDGALQGLTLAAGVDNVTDATYAIHPTNELNQPGRSFKMSGAVKF
ncbi:MAG: TonB-dependent hemoglobin/transferrin/lactoferrin family receptor [Pseudomonadota bacterium]